MTEFSGPLSGIKVLDLTTVFMGPFATQMLGDLGADVIKVEASGGDSTRTLGPNGEYGLGPLFLGLNRNKRSIVIDLKSAAGAELLLELTKSADVLATNIRPAAMARLGLGYARLAELNPQLIYASMVGFSQKGPYGPKAAYDDMMQAATGLAAVMGQQAEGEPRYVPLTIADRSVGLYAFGVIAAALYARTRTGKGQCVEIPMFETMVPYVLGDHLYGHTFVPSQGEFGYPRLMAKNRRPYKTKDGYVCCLIYTDRQWKIFLEAVGKGDLLKTDPRFAEFVTARCTSTSSTSWSLKNSSSVPRANGSSCCRKTRFRSSRCTRWNHFSRTSTWPPRASSRRWSIRSSAGSARPRFRASGQAPSRSIDIRRPRSANTRSMSCVRRGSASSGSVNWWPITSYSSGRSCSSGRKPPELISRFVSIRIRGTHD